MREHEETASPPVQHSQSFNASPTSKEGGHMSLKKAASRIALGVSVGGAVKGAAATGKKKRRATKATLKSNILEEDEEEDDSSEDEDAVPSAGTLADKMHQPVPSPHSSDSEDENLDALPGARRGVRGSVEGVDLSGLYEGKRECRSAACPATAVHCHVSRPCASAPPSDLLKKSWTTMERRPRKRSTSTTSTTKRSNAPSRRCGRCFCCRRCCWCCPCCSC